MESLKPRLHAVPQPYCNAPRSATSNRPTTGPLAAAAAVAPLAAVTIVAFGSTSRAARS